MPTHPVRCPVCQAPLELPEALLGATVRCGGCQNLFTAPAPPPPPPAPRRAAPAPTPTPAPSKFRERSRRDDDDEDDDRPRRKADRPKPAAGGNTGLIVAIAGVAGLFVLALAG